MQINSSGGSPVQSDDIYSHIVFLKEKKNIPVYAICQDVCTSGAYYIASSADYIYANPMSIIGSIGVRMDSFGFHELFNKLGIEHRVYTSGKNKNFLDQFKPECEEQVLEITKILQQVHNYFIKTVLKSRGERLKLILDQDIFSGKPFSGIQAKELGLIDNFGSINTIKINHNLENLSIIDFSKNSNIIDIINYGINTKINTLDLTKVLINEKILIKT